MRSSTSPGPPFTADIPLKTPQQKKYPLELPESILESLVTVEHEDDVLEKVQKEKERRLCRLVRRYVEFPASFQETNKWSCRYITQIQHGCDNPSCLTPTCLSYRKRIARAPLRKYSVLSARTLACFLASEKDPEAALCPNTSTVTSILDIPAERRPVPSRRTGVNEHDAIEASKEHISTATGKNVANPSAAERSFTARRMQRSSSHEHSTSPWKLQTVPSLLSGTYDRQQAAESRNIPVAADEQDKDPKSFSQSLFDALPLRMLEWVPLGRGRGHSASAFQPLASEGRQRASYENALTSGDPVGDESKTRDDGTPFKSLTVAPSVSTSYANGQARAPFDRSQRKDSDHILDLEVKKQIMRERKSHAFPDKPRRVSSTRSILLDESAKKAMPNTRNLDTISPNHGRLPPRLVVSATSLYNHQGVIGQTNVFSGSKVPSDSQAGELPKGDNLSGPYDVSTTSSNDQDLLSVNEDSRDLDSSGVAAHQSETIFSVSHLSLRILRDLQLLKDRMKAQRSGLSSASSTQSSAAVAETAFTRAGLQNNTPPSCPAKSVPSFIKQSLFFVLKNPTRLSNSFKDSGGSCVAGDVSEWPLRIQTRTVLTSFLILYSLRPHTEILQSLWLAVNRVKSHPPCLVRHVSRHKVKHTANQQNNAKAAAAKGANLADTIYFDEEQAAHTCVLSFYALIRLASPLEVPFGDVSQSWFSFRQTRPSGQIFPAALVLNTKKNDALTAIPRFLLELNDAFEDQNALRLLGGVVDAINNRLAYSRIANARRAKDGTEERTGLKAANIVQIIMRYLEDDNNQMKDDPFWFRRLPTMTLEWLRVLLFKEWDGNASSRRTSTFGGILQILAAMYESKNKLGLEPWDFHTSFFSDRLDAVEMPVEWLSLRPDNQTIHLLTYSFLFPPSVLVMYFRALNFSSMSKSFENALITTRDMQQFGKHIFIPNSAHIIDVMRPAMAIYLVLTIRRDNVVADAMNQIWRRQRRELMRPLKVRMGIDEGEEGLDHGGVQQEFFRVLFGQALDPKYGMFLTDERTQMTWFHAGSLEPPFKFEALGILMSIAVYNSITLPITFPLAFYRKLLGLKVKKLQHIADGWSDLAKGLQALLDWSGSDVADVFMRTYEFSFEAFGSVVDINMEKVDRDAPWPPAMRKKSKDKMKTTSFELTTSPERGPVDPKVETTIHCDEEPASLSPVPQSCQSNASSKAATPPALKGNDLDVEASVVTNETRERFVKDYIFWLTDKSVRPQFEAFARGFYTCLDKTALSIFTAEALQTVIEGIQEVDIGGLERVTKYEDGYEADTEIVKSFWEVVRAFSHEEKRQLLEFVTASDRLPVNGVSSIVFVLQRNGSDDTRLPTSMTCFGRLLLPHYSSKEILEEKLRKAIENAKGFGVA